MPELISALFRNWPIIEISELRSTISIIMRKCSPMPLKIRRFRMRTVDREWFIRHCDLIFRNRQRLKAKPCADFVVTGFVINSFGCPYYGYAIDKITLGNLIDLWNKGFIYKGFPLIHYRISHGDTSTHIAYVYRGEVFRKDFPYTDANRFIPTYEVKVILKELRKNYNDFLF